MALQAPLSAWATLVYLVVRGALTALQQATTGGQRYAGEHVLVGRVDDSRCVGLQALLQLAVGTGFARGEGSPAQHLGVKRPAPIKCSYCNFLKKKVR